MFKKIATGYAVINAFEVLKHDATGTDIKVADFRVTHLPVRQAYVMFGSINQAMRVAIPQRVYIWLACLRNGVVGNFFTITKTI